MADYFLSSMQEESEEGGLNGMKILAIDPGNIQSAILVWDGKRILHKEIGDNDVLISNINLLLGDILVIEQIRCMGMAVGATILDTVFWTGRFCERWEGDFHLMPRHEVKMHLCQSMRAKDSNIRQALIDRFGEPGTKKSKGLTYGLSKDLWQCFGLAVTWWDKHGLKEVPL